MNTAQRVVWYLLVVVLTSACAPTGGPARSAGQAGIAAGGEFGPVLDASAERPQRLFLQQVSSHGLIIKWRGNARQACVTEARLGFDAARCVQAVATEAAHQQAQFSGLQADTEYLYSVGGYNSGLLRFRSAPESGQLPADGSVQIWIVGDSGTASAKAGDSGIHSKSAEVFAGYRQYQQNTGKQKTDLMLMLGDNAYLEGTDEEWQVAVFDLYADLLSQVSLWSTIGNHEMGAGGFDVALIREEFTKLLGPVGDAVVEEHIKQLDQEGDVIYLGGASTSADPNSYATAGNHTPRRVPYLDILTLPEHGELGGVPSRTEQYYSFDYGNVHVVSLDSQLTARDPLQRLAMKDWLEADLESNQLPWTVVIFHHPVYSKSSHDSDTAAASSLMGIDQPMVDLRHEFTPVFEQYGVDLVFSGHSHAYERSWYLHGHRGDADTFDAAQNAELNARGEPAIGNGDEAYQQISPSSGQDDKVVYTVAGSSGHMSMGKGKLNHPAMAVQQSDPERRHGLAETGSVVIEAGNSEMVARFVNEKGAVLDTVVIQR